ncbi:hypothetical protein L195_g058956, partial [Trifolium pratense]
IHFDDSEEDCLLEDNFETVVDENVVDEPMTKGKGKKGKKVRQECNVSKPTSKKGRPKKKNNNSNIYNTSVVQGAQQTAQGDELFEQEDVGNIDKSKYKAFVGGLSDIEDYNSDVLDTGTDSDIENEVEGSEDEDEHDTERPSNYKLPRL